MTDEEKAIQGYKILNSINDWVTKCFTVNFGTIPSKITMGDRRFVEQLIKNYDQEIVRDAFTEARAQGVEKLAYIRETAKNMYEKQTTKKNLVEHDKIKKIEADTKWNPSEDNEWKEVLEQIKSAKVINRTMEDHRRERRELRVSPNQDIKNI